MAPEGGDVLPLKVHDIKLVYICVKKSEAVFPLCVEQKELVSGNSSETPLWTRLGGLVIEKRKRSAVCHHD